MSTQVHRSESWHQAGHVYVHKYHPLSRRSIPLSAFQEVSLAKLTDSPTPLVLIAAWRPAAALLRETWTYRMWLVTKSRIYSLCDVSLSEVQCSSLKCKGNFPLVEKWNRTMIWYQRNIKGSFVSFLPGFFPSKKLHITTQHNTGSSQQSAVSVQSCVRWVGTLLTSAPGESFGVCRSSWCKDLTWCCLQRISLRFDYLRWLCLILIFAGSAEEINILFSSSFFFTIWYRHVEKLSPSGKMLHNTGER